MRALCRVHDARKPEGLQPAITLMATPLAAAQS